MHVTVKRNSDQSTKKFDVEPNTKIRNLKEKIRAEFAPSFPHGAKLKYEGKVMKSLHSLKHYKIPDNGVIEMDDTKNWSSSSSSSNSD